MSWTGLRTLKWNKNKSCWEGEIWEIIVIYEDELCCVKEKSEAASVCSDFWNVFTDWVFCGYAECSVALSGNVVMCNCYSYVPILL